LSPQQKSKTKKKKARPANATSSASAAGADSSSASGAASASPVVAPAISPVGRLVAMDQLRGYTIAGMIFVNYLGRFDLMPWTVKHHRVGMSYADTIAPLFMFIVGMGFRLSFQRHAAVSGIWPARLRALKRNVILTLVGIVFYGVGDPVIHFSQHASAFDALTAYLGSHTGWWDALTDIGLAGILAIPFIDRAAWVRVTAAGTYLALYQIIYSQTGYGEWAIQNTINGGPLGPVSYVFVLLLGSMAYDLLATRAPRRIMLGALAWGVILCALGLALRLPWAASEDYPADKAYWYFTQYGMTAPYPIYATGLAFLAFLAFYLLNDVARVTIPTLTILGENALVMYIVHIVIMNGNEGYPPNNASIPLALAGYAVLYACCYAVARYMHNNRIFVKF